MINLSTLPPELLEQILLWTCTFSRTTKNIVLDQRRVCKTFDRCLQEILFQTLQVDVPMLMYKYEMAILDELGKECRGVHINMLGTREEDINTIEECMRESAPQTMKRMEGTLADLRSHSLCEQTMGTEKLARRLQYLLRHTPNLKRLKFTLPVAIYYHEDDPYPEQALSYVLSAFARRPEEHAPVEVLVISMLNEAALWEVHQNSIDSMNLKSVMKHVKNLILGIVHHNNKPEESNIGIFACILWTTVLMADKLETLCIVAERSEKCLPYPERFYPGFQPPTGQASLKHLRHVELRGINLEARDLLTLCKESKNTLKGLYLIDIKLKDYNVVDRLLAYWVGDDGPRWHKEVRYLASNLAAIKGLQLEDVKATNLGYENPSNQSKDHWKGKWPHLTLETKFVAIVLRLTPGPQENISDDEESSDEEVNHSQHSPGGRRINEHRYTPMHSKLVKVDGVSHLRHVRNLTSRYRDGVDDVFLDGKSAVYEQLMKIQSLSASGVLELQHDIEAALASTIDPDTGAIIPGVEDPDTTVDG